jgi:site-specific recombinase XerD
MGIKRYHTEELTSDWARARDASIHYGELRNHRSSTKKNDHRGSLWVACDFMDMGVESAEAITDKDWLNLVERYRAGQTRSGNPLTEGSIRKRKEALVQILKATKLNDILHFVEMWKKKKESNETTYWNLEEMEAMNQHVLRLAQETKMLKFAVVHLLHYHIAPRRQASAKFKWDYIDLNEATIQFSATKNDNRCVSFIEPRFLPIFKKYKQWLEEHGHGDTYLFPTSNAGKSGTTKVKRPYVSDKTINSWLAKVRNGAAPFYGGTIRPYSSHTYRHSLAMRFLNSGAAYEDVGRVLGDSVATVEEHYSDLGFTPAFRKAWETAHVRSTMNTTEGTAQPEWLDRFRKVRTPDRYKPLAPHSRGTDSRLVADVPGFEPGFSA